VVGYSLISSHLSIHRLPCLFLRTSASTHKHQNICVSDMAAQYWNRSAATLRYILFHAGGFRNANCLESHLFNHHGAHLASITYRSGI
jgi:hypothetical protein